VGTLWLVGMMGAGKSTVGPPAAAAVGVSFFDIDDAAAGGRAIPEIFAREGEAAFRAAEADQIAAHAGRIAVVACGGGAVLDARSVALMRASGTVVWLDADPEVLASRVGDGTGRPLLEGDPAGAIATIAAERHAAYRSAAHHRIDTGGLTPAQAAEQVARLWGRAHGSELVIGRDVLDAGVLPARTGRAAAGVLAQPGSARIARSLARRIGAAGVRAPVRILPDGEDAKDLAVAAEVYAWLVDEGLTRSDTIVGVGGGALTDVAGFVAATYLRGLEAVYVATTLVSAVDAALGGKTALNLEGKNLVGVFRHPARIVVDVAVLEALPEPLLREGAAEALKTGMVGDPDLVALYEAAGLDADVEEVVRRSTAVKQGIVARDPFDRGERNHLNYGHTVGHAVETASRIGHGDAVAVGMVAAGRASALVLGFAEEERQRSILDSLGLPTAARGSEAAVVRAQLARDKKRDAEGLRMVLLAAAGAPGVHHVDSATVDAALAAVGIT
jgi:3-dehydroquinate synthase/shikimate kinase/3-dehydroquinate synthase